MIVQMTVSQEEHAARMAHLPRIMAAMKALFLHLGDWSYAERYISVTDWAPEAVTLSSKCEIKVLENPDISARAAEPFVYYVRRIASHYTEGYFLPSQMTEMMESIASDHIKFEIRKLARIMQADGRL